MQTKELIILGGGPAGLSASVYSARYKIDHLLISSEIGGYLNEIHLVENYPGVPSISGFELKEQFKRQIEQLGVDMRMEMIKKITKKEGLFEVETNNQLYFSKNIIYALGTRHRKLEIPGEDEFFGKGVSYCATCDGPFFKNKTVVIAGGGNSAATAAIMLSEHAKKVYVIYRSETLKCTPTYCDRLKADPKINLIKKANVKKVIGDKLIKKVILDKKFKGTNELIVDGLFVEIGSAPEISPLKSLDLELDQWSFITTRPDQSTNITGFYAAGDITTNSNGFRQLITASAEGSIAALSVFENLKK